MEKIETFEAIAASKVKQVELKFGKKFITRSLRGQNYDLETALSELVDNSIDAESKNVNIAFPKKSEFNKENSTITIIDDGNGMSEEELINSMTLGSDRDYDSSDIGYFGIGMKASLAYLSERVIIKTKKQGDNFYSIVEWDVDKDATFFVRKELTKKVKEKGTTITIFPGHRYECYSHTQDSIIKKKFGARYFHLLFTNDIQIDKYSKQIRININGTVIEPLDPMYRNGEDIITHPTIEIPFRDDSIKLNGYTLLNYANSDKMSKYDIHQGHKGGLSYDKQGVYVLYNNKYINLGGTFLGHIKTHPDYNYLRIELSIPKSSTEYFGMSMNKNSISEFLSEEKNIDVIKDKIKKHIGEITYWFKQELTKKKRGQILNDPDKLKELESITNKVNNELKTKGITKNPLSNPDISEKIPTQEKNTKTKNDPKGTKNRPNQLSYEKNLFDFVPYSGGEHSEFWEIKRDGQKIVMRVNVDHMFYKEFIDSVSEEDKKKTYKLLYSLAWAQLETFGSYHFDGKIHDLWQDFWHTASLAIKRTLS
jgi:hypothetical protein